MYLLFGGVPKQLPDIAIRGDMNVLFIGDPGTAKSQLLQYVARISPRGLYTSGRGSTAAGLTAAVLSERGGGMTLEAGALVLADKGEQEGKGRLVEFNVRNNENVKELEGNIRVKTLPDNKLKIGVFVHKFTLNSNFMNLLGKGVGEMILRTKLNDMLRNLEKYCKTHDSLADFL